MIGSWSSPSRNSSVFAHLACTDSNWRARLAWTVMKITPVLAVVLHRTLGSNSP